MYSESTTVNSSTWKDRPLNVGNMYQIGAKLGVGSFGTLYEAVHIETGKKYAIKVESAKSRQQLLHHEANVLRALISNSDF